MLELLQKIGHLVIVTFMLSGIALGSSGKPSVCKFVFQQDIQIDSVSRLTNCANLFSKFR